MFNTVNGKDLTQIASVQKVSNLNGCGGRMWNELSKKCEEDMLTKDNLETSLCFVFYLSFERCDVLTYHCGSRNIYQKKEITKAVNI